MNIIKDNSAVNEIIGTITMLLVATSIFVASFAVVMSSPTPPSKIFVDLEASIMGENITILHKGGEALPLETNLTIKIGNNAPGTSQVGDLLDPNFHENGWNIGEQIIISVSLGETIRILVVDNITNTLLMDVTLFS